MLQLQHAKSVAEALRVLVQASMFSSADASRLTSLLQGGQQSDTMGESMEEQSEEATAFGAPDAAVYESHSGGIIDTLEGLLDKAQDQLANSRKTETTSQHNYEMLKQSLTDEMKFGNQDMADAKKALAESAEAKATAEGDLGVTSKALAADEKSLADLHQDCME